MISAKKYRGDFEGFFQEVVKTWDEQWDLVYDSRNDQRGAPRRPHHPKTQLVEYDTRALVVLLGSVGCACVLAALALAAAAARIRNALAA